MKDLSNNNKDVTMYAGALALDACMSHIRKQGEGVDVDTEELIIPNKTYHSCKMHYFDGLYSQRRIKLENEIIAHSPKWSAFMRFRTDQVFPEPMQNFGPILIMANEMDVMFYALGPQIALGPFFSLDSVLKQKLTEFLKETELDYQDPAQKGSALWNFIVQNGSLPALCSIWDSLMHERVYPRLLGGLVPMFGPCG